MRSYPAFDQIVHVEYRAYPELLWLGAGFEVRIGDRVFRADSARPRIFGRPWTTFELEYQGKRVRGMVRGVRCSSLQIHERYSFVVGHSELARETQLMRGWLLHYVAVLALWTVLILGVSGIGFAALVAWGHLHPGHGG